MVTKAVQIVIVTITTVMMVLALVVNYLSTSYLGYEIGLFSNKGGLFNRSDNLTESSLTPPGWAFGVWGVIYLYQVVLLLYCWSLVFRTANGRALCCIPGLLPIGFLASHCASSVFNIAWLLVTDRATGAHRILLIPQTIILFSIAISLWICIVISAKQLHANGQELQRMGLRRECWLVIALLQNACGLYAGWTSIASFLNLDIAILNLTDYPVESSALLCLCELCLLISFYVTADFFFLNSYLRFVFAPYCTVLWALATSSIYNYHTGSAKSVVSVQLAALLAAVLVAKVVAAIIRQRRSPQLGGKSHSSHERMLD